MNMNITQKLEGFYNLKVHGGKRGEIDFGTHKNMILDAGITHMLNGNSPLRNIHIGSGSSQPNPKQVQLDEKFAHTSRLAKVTNGYVSAEDSASGKAYGYDRFSVQFDKGAAKGNIAELGVGSNTQGNPLWSRSLVLDKKGNPTTITVLDDEFLTVTYEVRRYVNTQVIISTLQYDDDGEMKNVECKITPSSDKGESGWGASGAGHDGVYVREGGWENSSIVYASVDNNTAIFLPKFDINKANRNISFVTINTRSGSLIPEGTRVDFNPPLRKTNEFELTIGVTVTIERA